MLELKIVSINLRQNNLIQSAVNFDIIEMIFQMIDDCQFETTVQNHFLLEILQFNVWKKHFASFYRILIA